jgi:hypothetical protein
MKERHRKQCPFQQQISTAVPQLPSQLAADGQPISFLSQTYRHTHNTLAWHGYRLPALPPSIRSLALLVGAHNKLTFRR